MSQVSRIGCLQRQCKMTVRPGQGRKGRVGNAGSAAGRIPAVLCDRGRLVCQGPRLRAYGGMSGNCTCLTSQCRPLRGSCSRTGFVASAGIDSSYPPPHPLHSRKQRIVDQYLQLCSGIGKQLGFDARRCSYQSSDAFS